MRVRYPGTMLALFLLACFLRPATRVDVREAAMAEADSHFLARAGTEGARELSRAVDGWTLLLASSPRDGALLARLAQAHWILSQTEPGEARVHLEVGEEFGWRCLLADPAFSAAHQASGGGVIAAEALSASDAPCVAWLAANALDRAELRGDGAALAVEEQQTLLARWRVVGGEASPWAPVPGLQPWLEARAALLRARDPDARQRAVGRLVEVAQRAPGVLRWRLDLARAGGAASPPEDDGDPAFALENAAARAAWAKLSR